MISQPVIPSVQVRYGLLEIHVALQLQDAAGGATGTARSGLYEDGRRGIRIWLPQLICWSVGHSRC
jgi:hypothetical protein